jgi:hypothetical protein
MLGVTGAAAVSHHPQFMPFLKPSGHPLAQLGNLIGALGEKAFFDLH